MPTTDMPDYARLGSFHVVELADGAMALARFDTDGWTIYRKACRVDASAANRLGVRHARELIEGRRILSGG